MDLDYVEYEDYTPGNDTESNTTTAELLNFSSSRSAVTHVLVAVNILITVIGLGGNSLVIWICGWKMKRTVITTWYISLAISDFLFCAFLPLEVFYMITSHWPFGLVLCKLTSSALFLNMYSSVFLLVLISTDRCIMISFPVWSHNHRNVRKAFGVVVLMWLLSALLTLPSMIFRQTIVHGSVTQCYTDYKGHSGHKVVALTRFICGFLIPILIILYCCSVLGVKLRSLTIKSTKPYKVMAALILSFFFCWVPYHAFVLLELDLKNQSVDVLQTGLKVGATLAAANSFISPVLYVFIGNDFKQTLKRSLTSRIEDAMEEDFRTGALNHSRSKSMEII
ncbi:chemokine-like receptor 1 [Seriola lalandi dorsalis]|uniref:Chemerin chemokine-like receptor 1 n=1 Tax=Seriola lalandi dorsalis TaxID=1841481 RepID=A0A3B4XJ33_SERLL|nr:chemokine-like receptor 1 [Seriola lalandi dorsalis]XP_056259738.1 chemerin-like receptor 1 [Seriola aureovittata]